MARRFYLPSAGTPPLGSLAYGTGWNRTVGSTRLPLARILTETATATRSSASTATNPEFQLLGQFQSPALAAQTISGTIKGQFRCSANVAALVGTLAISARIVSSDGSTIRGELIGPTPAASQSSATPPAFATTACNRSIKDSTEDTTISLNPVTSISGDYLVIEIGFRDASGGVETGLIRFQDLSSASDLPEDETTTTSGLNPWVEFSGSVVFADEVAVPLMSQWINNSWDVLHVLKRRFKRIATRVSRRDS